MSDDFVTLRLIVVSESATERDVLRHAASQASVPLIVTDIDATALSARSTPVAWQRILAAERPDVVVIDGRIDAGRRALVADAARDADTHPLILALVESRDGPAVDGADIVLSVPADPVEARSAFESCVRARIGSRVLIVDDSSTVRSVVRKVLQASRYRIESHEAADGATALGRAVSEHFDLVFLDCIMPDQDGFETLASLRSLRPDIKVVMMTAASDPALADRARAAGAHDLLFKPFYGKDIDGVLNRLFGLARPPAA